jgi:hypothetical protein
MPTSIVCREISEEDGKAFPAFAINEPTISFMIIEIKKLVHTTIGQ